MLTRRFVHGDICCFEFGNEPGEIGLLFVISRTQGLKSNSSLHRYYFPFPGDILQGQCRRQWLRRRGQSCHIGIREHPLLGHSVHEARHREPAKQRVAVRYSI